MTGHIADLQLVSTERAAASLAAEGITDKVLVTGNSVIDALYIGLGIIAHRGLDFSNDFAGTDFGKKLVLVTAHRRENHGSPIREICQSILELTTKYADIQVIYPVHLNPKIQEPVYEMLDGRPNICLCAPVDYQRLIWLMLNAYSGGVQEEGPALGKPVLVLRDVTECLEGVDAGTAILVGVHKERILEQAGRLLEDAACYQQMSKAVSPCGAGTAARQVIEHYYSLITNG